VEVSEPLPLPEDSEVEKAEAELIPEDNMVKNVVEDFKLLCLYSINVSERSGSDCFLLIPDTVQRKT
jgi:hypothetical protein